MVGSIDGGQPRSLVATDNNAAYASGYLLFTRERILMARPFDPDNLTFGGEESPVVDDLTVFPGASLAVFSVSRNGVLVFDRGPGRASIELAWLDREGKHVGTLGPPGDYEEPQLSPDGRRLAVDLQEPTTGRQDIWIVGTDRGIPTRLTTGESESVGPVWLPDGKHVVFRTRAGGFLDLYERALDGEGGNKLLLKTDSDKEATSASPDGRFLAYRSATQGTGFDIWMLPLKGSEKPFPYLQSKFDENNARFSPDGRWVAFDSNESGREEVYVASLPQAGGKLRVSTDGGRVPRWSRDGKELFFLTVDYSELMAAPVTYRGADVLVGTPIRLFRAPFLNSGDYDVGNGRFLFTAEQGIVQRSPLSLVLNWPELSKKGVAR
jgi:Tol biopolymer transport system component